MGQPMALNLKRSGYDVWVHVPLPTVDLQRVNSGMKSMQEI